MEFEDSYKRIRNRIRPYSKTAFLEACLSDIQSVPLDRLADLKRAPWLTFLLAKWSLQDRMVLPQGKAVSSDQVDQLKQSLWDLTSGLSNNPSVRLMLRQMVYVQVEMQRPQDKGVAREAAVLNALDTQHRLRTFIASRIGINPVEYVLVLMASLGMANSAGLHLNPNNFRSLESFISRHRLLQCLNALFPNWGAIETYVRNLPDRNHKRLSELTEYPRLARWPGVFIPGNRIELWHPAFMHRAFEGFLHRAIASGDPSFIASYGDAFEEYVSRVLTRTPARMLTEVDLRQAFGDNRRVVDFVLSYESANVLVECKNGVFYDQIMDVSSSSILFDKSRRIRKAVSQGVSTSHSINTDDEDKLSLKGKKEYHLIVLSHEVYFGSASRMEQIFPPEADLGFSEYRQCRLTKSDVYVISIGDFERMIVAEQQGMINVPEFIASCISADSHPATAKMLMEQHLTAHGIPMLVSQEVQNLFGRANSIFAEILPR